MSDPTSGEIVWVVLDPVVDRERQGRRPAVVVSSRAHISIADTLVMVVPVTSVNRGWSNHVLLRGDVLDRDSWAMTEQVRTISRQRVVGRAGQGDPATLTDIRQWIPGFLGE